MSDHSSCTDLYRLYNDEGDLLYVGISLNAAKRVAEHRRDKNWWPEVSVIKIQRILHTDRAGALFAEKEVIRAENPKYNVVNNCETSSNQRASVDRHWDFGHLALGDKSHQAFLELMRSMAEMWFIYDETGLDPDQLEIDLPILFHMAKYYFYECRQCRQHREPSSLPTAQPYAAHVKDNWATMYYWCEKHHNAYTCGWSVEDKVLPR
jgi:predicted GIY-YIG superfamily endonuclease